MSIPVRSTCLAALLLTPACCVAATTRIRTPRGDITAGSLVVGDVVHAIDVATGELRPATIVLIRRATRECLVLRWPGGALVCTPDHPLYAPETATYRPASDWVTGPARVLLAAGPEGVREVTVTTTEYSGVHDVLDIALDVEPHNFIAEGVVVHNKSPSTYSSEGEVDGPTLGLGGMEMAAYRIHVCVDGADEDVVLRLQYTTRSVLPPTTNVAFEVSVAVDGDDQSSGPVPSDEEFQPEHQIAAPCTDGIPVAFRRSDSAPDGEIEVSWSAHAFFGHFYDENEADDHKVVVTIEPET